MTLKEKIAKLRADIAAKSKELEADIATVKATKTAEDIAASKALTDALNALNDELDQALEMQKALGRTAALPATDDPAVPAQVAKKLTTEEKVGIIIGGLVKANGERSKSAFQHIEEMGYSALAKDLSDFRTKAPLQAGSASQGGVLVPTDMANEIVEILRPDVTILQVPRMRRIPMPNGNYKLPAGATGANASYQGEVAAASVTGQTFREVDLTAKTLTAIIPVTNDLINFSISGAMGFVQTDLRNALGQTMDSNLWRGSGGTNQPVGIMKLPGVSTYADTNTNTPTYTQVDAAVRVLILALQNAYIPETSWAWVMPKRVIGYLQDLRSSTGVPIYPGMQMEPGKKTFKGYPVLETTNFPLTLNTRGNNNDTEIALVAGEHVLFGESMPLELAVSSEAAIEVSGTVQSMFQRRQTAVLAVMQHDINLRHLGAVAVLTGVQWGG